MHTQHLQKWQHKHDFSVIREHGHGHHDHNLRAAYLHVLADAFTSMLAIGALVAGKYFGWLWLDSVMGIVGAAVITKWAHGLLKETSGIRDWFLTCNPCYSAKNAL